MTDAPSEATRVALRRALHDARPLPPARPPTARVLALRAVLVAAKLGVVVAVPTTIVAILGAGFYVRAVLEIRVPGLALASWSAVVAVLWACYHAWKGQRSAAHHGVLVAPREAPQLFALLSDVARVAETEPP
ncbi:MAG: hypothetical protein R3F34_11380, partial [Planctomycetota bacterium]